MALSEKGSFISYLLSLMVRAQRAVCCAVGALCRLEVGYVASEKACQKSLLCRKVGIRGRYHFQYSGGMCEALGNEADVGQCGGD